MKKPAFRGGLLVFCLQLVSSHSMAVGHLSAHLVPAELHAHGERSGAGPSDALRASKVTPERMSLFQDFSASTTASAIANELVMPGDSIPKR